VGRRVVDVDYGFFFDEAWGAGGVFVGFHHTIPSF
jgi:hypothetical protein